MKIPPVKDRGFALWTEPVAPNYAIVAMNFHYRSVVWLQSSRRVPEDSDNSRKIVLDPASRVYGTYFDWMLV
jgi:hypothetical protein